MTGTVQTITDKGFAFLRGADGRTYFFHRSDISDQSEWKFDDLRRGDRVEFQPVEPQPPKGPRASGITWVSDAPEPAEEEEVANG